MVKLIVGLKGSGKTKALIEMVNAKVNETPGSVVCLEKGGKLIHEINYQARLIDTDEYKIGSADALYGFLAGIYASNHDLTDLFIDSALKICNNQIDTFEQLERRITSIEVTVDNLDQVKAQLLQFNSLQNAIKKIKKSNPTSPDKD